MSRNRNRYLAKKRDREESQPQLAPPRPIQPHRKKKPHDNMESFNILMVVSFFMASFYVFHSFFSLDIDLFNLLQFYCLFIGLGFLIPIKLYRKKLTMSFYEYLLFNLLSFSPVLIALFFFVNNSFKGGTYVETYNIAHYELNEYGAVYTLEKGQYKDKTYLRSVNQNNNAEVLGNSKLSIYFSDGLFGLRIIENKVLH